MNYTLMPSLEYITVVKIAATLWNQDDIRALMPKYGKRDKWQMIEDKVVEKIPHLSQPGVLKEEILDFVELLGLKILKYKEYLDENCFLGKYVLKDICWTPQGTVDEKRAAEMFIKDDSIDITRRYRLACTYCLEDDIPELWKKLPENERKTFYSEEDPRQVIQEPLVVLWTYDLKGEVARMDNIIERRWQRKCSLYQYAFEYATVNNNKVATKYFLQKLTPAEKDDSLVRSIEYLANRLDSGYNHTDRSDVLCFLLSQMSDEQQIEVFKNHHYTVLNCLLDWPWQSFFMEAANRMWDFLSGEDYYYLLSTIIYKVIDGCKGCNYQKLFGEFWQQSTSAHKNHVVTQCTIGFLLSILFETEDERNIKLILKDATVEQKRRFIFGKGKDICQNLLYSNKWDLLKVFVQECITSSDELIKFKEEFKNLKVSYCSKEKIASNKDKWDKFYQVLDDLIFKYDEKESMQEIENSLAKGFLGKEFTKDTSDKKK